MEILPTPTTLEHHQVGQLLPLLLADQQQLHHQAGLRLQVAQHHRAGRQLHPRADHLQAAVHTVRQADHHLHHHRVVHRQEAVRHHLAVRQEAVVVQEVEDKKQ